MARIRKACAYRRIERPYTRVSKYREQSFVRGNPAKHIVRYAMGNTKGKFSSTISLKSDADLQIRDNALESARQTSNRHLENSLGKTGYHMVLRVYPFHILRENPLAAGAGADRMSTGMKHSFGKVIGRAAQIKKGKVIFEVMVDKANIAVAKAAMKKAQHKLPCSCSIVIR